MYRLPDTRFSSDRDFGLRLVADVTGHAAGGGKVLPVGDGGLVVGVDLKVLGVVGGGDDRLGVAGQFVLVGAAHEAGGPVVLGQALQGSGAAAGVADVFGVDKAPSW